MKKQSMKGVDILSSCIKFVRCTEQRVCSVERMICEILIIDLFISI